MHTRDVPKSRAIMPPTVCVTAAMSSSVGTFLGLSPQHGIN